VTDDTFKWRWAHVDQSGRADQYVGILNRMRASDDPASFPATLAWIAAQPGERILEVGCGNGAVARAVARQTPAVREVVAVDTSAAMIAEAQRQTAGRDLPISFQVADAQHLPFADATFDRCYAMELFVILPDPYQALLEMGRVTRPGGHICLRESDCDTHAMLGSDLALTRRLMRFVGDCEYNGAVGRQLIGWCKELGWQVQVVPAVGTDEDGTFLQAVLLPEWLADAQRVGVVTAAEAEQVLADVRYRQQAGTSFSYTVNFRISAIKDR
jgi:ubiquinone/menaquinone biosynthesis C-methylase UbiE